MHPPRNSSEAYHERIPFVGFPFYLCSLFAIYYARLRNQATGIERAAGSRNETAGRSDFKHLVEREKSAEKPEKLLALAVSAYAGVSAIARNKHRYG